MDNFNNDFNNNNENNVNDNNSQDFESKNSNDSYNDIYGNNQNSNDSYNDIYGNNQNSNDSYNSIYGDNQGQYQGQQKRDPLVYTGSDEVSVKEWIGQLITPGILTMIPFIGWLLSLAYIVYMAVRQDDHPTRQNFYRATLILGAIGLAITIITMVIFGRSILKTNYW